MVEKMVGGGLRDAEQGGGGIWQGTQAGPSDMKGASGGPREAAEWYHNSKENRPDRG